MKNKIECKLCNKLFERITITHLKKHHDINIANYKLAFPNAETVSEYILFRINTTNTSRKMSEKNILILNNSEKNLAKFEKLFKW